MNKRAQYFLIAALLLSGVILTIGKVYVSSKIEKEGLRVYDLSDQIQYESSQVIDNGLFAQKSSQETKEQLKNLTSYYAQLNPDSDIDIIYGNLSSLSLIEYNLTSSSTIDKQIQTNTSSQEGTGFSISPEKRLKIKIANTNEEGSIRAIENELALEEGQNFYLVVRKKIRGEDIIVYR